MPNWNCALELNGQRDIVSGSSSCLCDAIRNGADLQIYTEFRHNEHIDTSSIDAQIIQEVSEFRATYLIDNKWVAGIMTLRQPISLPNGFGERPSMSFFLYNQDGSQAISRLYLDNLPAPDISNNFTDMPKYHKLDDIDSKTNAPAHNFIYDFSVFRYMVRNNWKESLSHNSDGEILSGSVDALANAFRQGCEIKVGILGLCNDLFDEKVDAIDHEVFIQCGYNYYYTEKKLFIAGTHPLVRVCPNIPLKYESHNWDYSWIMLRTDGYAVIRACCPYTLKFKDVKRKFCIRWFVR